MKFFYFDRYFSLPTGYRYLLRQVPRYIATLSDYFPDHDNQKPKLLDIGCGTQPYKKLLTKFDYIGMDNYAEAQAKTDIKGSITDIPQDDQSFDAAMSVFVLDDVFELDAAFAEISRILKPGGYYFAFESQTTHIHNPPHDFFRFAPNALKAMAEKNGMELQNYQSYGGDFASAGFSCILAFRHLFSRFGKKGLIIRPFYCLFFNIIFAPLDWVARQWMGPAMENNSLGYFYIFKKV